jgi:hypothetical protein
VAPSAELSKALRRGLDQVGYVARRWWRSITLGKTKDDQCTALCGEERRSSSRCSVSLSPFFYSPRVVSHPIPPTRKRP